MGNLGSPTEVEIGFQNVGACDEVAKTPPRVWSECYTSIITGNTTGLRFNVTLK